MTNPHTFDMQPLAKVESAWHAPWMLIGCSQQGPQHYKNGALNADSYKLGRNGARAWLVVADGVGSMPLAYHGSRAATAAVEQHLALTANQPLTLATMRDAFAAAHNAITAAAKDKNLNPFSYATTLSAVAIEDNVLVGGSIGDSGIVTCSRQGDDGETLMAAFCSSPQSELPHKTFTMSDPNWETCATFNETLTPALTAVLLATDGADNFFLEPSKTRDGEEYRTDMVDSFDAAIAALAAPAFFTFFASYLQKYGHSNNDDRTLLIAYRVPEKHAPPAPQPR